MNDEQKQDDTTDEVEGHVAKSHRFAPTDDTDDDDVEGHFRPDEDEMFGDDAERNRPIKG